MQLGDSTEKQLNDLADWLRLVGQDEPPPSMEQWKAIRRGLTERAYFLRTFVTPYIASPMVKANIERLRNTEPKQPV